MKGKIVSWTFERSPTVILISDDYLTRELVGEILSGRDCESGECRIGNISSKNDTEQYRKMIDCVMVSDVYSELLARDYLNFYAMISNKYTLEMEKEIRALLRGFNKDSILFKKVDDLFPEDRIIVRCLVAYIKGTSLLIGNNVLRELDNNSKRLAIGFINYIFASRSSQCILLEEKWEGDRDIKVDIIRYDE